MFEKIKKNKKRIVAFALSLVTVLTTVIGNTQIAQAASGTLNFQAGASISYGDYLTTRMTFDGENTAYCVQPLMPTPSSGSYAYDLLGNDSSVRKALFYLQGGYGYDANVKEQCLSGWSSNDAYVIGHLVVAYLYSGGNGSEAFYEAPQSYIDKAHEVMNRINSLPAPPNSFKAFIVPGQGVQTICGSWYEKPNGWIEIQKTKANSSISDGNGNYSLEGATFGIFKDGNQVATLTTDANGYAKSGELEEGSYTVKELGASKGYAINVDVHGVEVKSEETSRVEVSEVEQNNPMDLVLQKIDSETEEAKAQGAASLENAEFTVKFYTTQSNTDPAGAGAQPARTWIFKTDAEGKVQFTKDYLVNDSEFYYQLDGKTPCLPLGTVTVQETKAPTGYHAEGNVYLQQIVAGGTVETVECYNASTIKEQVYRGDLEFVKVSDGDLNRLANIPFKITSLSTGESHVIVTDKNGYASTAAKWNKHTTNTNAGKTSEDGIWFGTSAPDNNKGALIYDDYEIEELRCDGNKGMNLLKFNVSIYKDAVTVPLGTLTDDKIEIVTTALDEESGSQLSKPDEKVTLVDTVEYEGLKKGQEYKVIGTLMDEETGKAVEIDGKAVTAETTFTAKKSSGNVEVTFELDGTSLKGKTVVVFEELYHDDLQLAVHADIDDTDQTIYFPEIGTTAKDAESGTNVAKADDKVTLVDTVAYKNLIAGKEYKVIGTLMDKETEKAVEVDGKAITAEATFKPESTEGTTDVTFEFDGRVLAGKTVVVFESVSYKEKEIAVHADIDDEGQTIYFPEIGTTATDQEDGDHEALADTEVTITDTVEYKNLTPGTDYKVSGVLMDKETGKEVLINEKNVVSEATFKAEKEEGTVDVTFTFDGSALAGHDVVVYEKLFAVTAEAEIEVAAHEDITDEGQTVKLVEEPKPETPKETIETPKTGDESNVGAWIATAVICLGALAGYGIHMLRKKKKEDKEEQ